MFRKFFAVCALGLALSACSTVKAIYHAETTPVDLNDVRKAALSVDLSYEAALDLANTYAALDVCGKAPSKVICSDPKVVAELVALDAKAQPFVDAMNKTVQTDGIDASIAKAAIAAATNAVEAFKAKIPVPAKGA